MQQKKRQKLRVSDFLLVLVCLSVCAVSLWFFWKDLNSSSTRTDVDSIATIHFKRKVSQRKFDDRVVWERLQQDSALYDKDTIRTSDGAEAVILFSDGTKVDLTENTMIQIGLEKDGSVNLSVGGGNVEVDTTASTSESVKLSMGDGSSVSLEKGSRITAASGGDSGSGAATSFTVKDGNAVVSNAAGETQKLSNGEAISVEKNGELSRQNITVTSISKNLRVYKTEEKVEPVKLSWKALSDSKKPADVKVKVEVSTDKDFTNIIEQYSAQGSSSLDVVPDAENEKLFWRVYQEDEEEKSVEGVITVVELSQMQLNSPLDNSVFSYRKELPSLRFNWKNDDYAESYKMEVSRTQDFVSPLITESLKSTSYTTASLDKGKYYWRVTPYYTVNSIGYAEASPVYSFEIEEREALTEPALSLPADAAKIVLGDAEQNVIFSWKSDVKTADYSIQLADNPDFTNIRQTIKSSATTIGEHFTIKTLPEGTYYWRVLRNSEEDRESGNDHALSLVRSFTVSKYLPGVNKLSWPPDGYSVEAGQLARLNFTWKLASEYKSAGLDSVLQISKTDAFNNILESQILSKMEYSGASLASGNYYWRVGVIKDGKESSFSEPNKLRVLNPMQAPKVIKPEEAAKLVVAYSEPVSFEWQPVAGADYYRLLVYDAEGNTVKSERVNEAKVKLELPVAATSPAESASPIYTKYRTVVQAFAKETEISSSRFSEEAEVTFEVRRPLPVTLLSPVNNKSYDGLTALRTPVQLTWKSGDVTTRTVLTLQKQNSNGSWRTVRTMENPKTTVSLSRLTEGRYRWNVSASGERGIALDSSSETFVIRPVPLLEGAVLSEPSNNLKMDAAYLKSHRNISFKWKKVTGATDYDFAIYQLLANGTYKRIYSQTKVRGTELRIKDLSIFDVGTFEWRVTAYSHAKDGYEEQKSNAATARFKIDFGLPAKVKTEDPGTMYGE
ncbi:FecR domain-containing protein [Treponema bryantii]|uniref:FecR domain-containing protein n=1 Tax=Treponema bryantii TaxID=163 RepID=UPI0003B621B0|nr:FecR domain-containing protein [Treponema bryantii]